jgi:competence protein ComEA
MKNILLALLTLAWLGTALAAVDINTASEAQLRELKGIGPSTARAIVQDRTDHGPFKSADDLSTRVKGLGPKSLTKLEGQGLTVSGTAASAKGGSQKSVESRGGKAGKKS